jgi:signal transduction histidine kinase
MMAVVAHDLRNPVNTIALGVAALRKEALLREQRTHQLEIMQRAVSAMDHLIRDLLDVTRMESGLFVIERGPTAISDLIDEALVLFETAASQREISLQCNLPPGRAVVAGDYHRLLQVLSNVIGNALKFTPRGGAITVSMRAASLHLELSVEDTGPGVPAEEIPLLFDRFWRAPCASQSGTGLGLHICKGIVEAHGGRIWAEHAPGSGLKVCWTVPFAGPDATTESRSV